MDFVENLPSGVYRVKGTVRVAAGSGQRDFVVQAVGPNVYVAEAARPAPKAPSSNVGDGEGPDADSVLVVIGEDFDTETAEATLTTALNSDAAGGLDVAASGSDRSERLLHHVRLHT